jgi:outer membrane biosynthesis protein TonB
VGKLKLILSHNVMQSRWFLLVIITTLIAVPSFAQKLPSDLQNQVDRGFLTREEAQLLNSARGQTSSSPKNAKKPTSDKAGSKAPRNCDTGDNHASKTYTSPGEDGHGPEIDFGPYILAVKRRVRRNWHAPSGPERTTILNFFISRSGNVNKLKIFCSSGDPVTDQGTIDAVLKSAPFDPLPAIYLGDAIELHFTFHMDDLSDDATVGG